MKTSRNWLQRFFEETLPSVEEISEALTFHVVEVEETREDFLDVKILPDRAAYLLCHRGIAYELSAILDKPMKEDPLRQPLPVLMNAGKLEVSADPAYVLRHTGALIRGVTISPSPEWLRTSLESIGQRSINNVVDILNFVMFNIGQPSGAFDAGKLITEDGVIRIAIRRARNGEKIKTLTGETYELNDSMFAFTDAANDALLDIAGIKGGLEYGITTDTKDLFISVGTYNPTLLRRASQALKLFTDASQRYQNRPSPELTMYGMRDILGLITEIAGGEVIDLMDVYPDSEQAKNKSVSVSVENVNGTLGSTYSKKQIEDVFKRLDFTSETKGGEFTVTAPFERRDIVIPEDLAEEVGRIIGYDSLPAAILPPRAAAPDQARYRNLERLKDLLVERGFTEISTQSFAKEGDIYLANPLDQTKPALRTTLAENMKDALQRAALQAPRVLGPAQEIKLFEIGTVFTKSDEHLSLALGYKQLVGKPESAILEETIDAVQALIGKTETKIEQNHGVAEISLQNPNQILSDDSYQPKKITLGAFKPFSQYPFALRDVAVWTPAETEPNEVENIILKEAGDLLERIDLFDRFEKKNAAGEAERLSYAFRLVFESNDRTLSDADLNPIIERVTNALNTQKGWEVR